MLFVITMLYFYRVVPLAHDYDLYVVFCDVSECAFPNYGVNCANTCSCGLGADRCDPALGCVCLSGWTGITCDDNVNECTDNPDICGDNDKVCTDIIGSFTCTCRTGLQLDSNSICVGMCNLNYSFSKTC